MHKKDLRGASTIFGVAESDLGEVRPGLTPTDLMAQGTARAPDDCGLRLSDVDGVFAATTQLNMPTLSLAEYLGICPKYLDSTQIGGSSFMAHVNHARAAIATGLCEVAVIAYGSTQRTHGRSTAAPQEISAYEAPYRARFPVAAYALAASRHMHKYGTTRSDLAAVAVLTRRAWRWGRG